MMKKGPICLCFLLLSALACAFAENIFTPKAQELPTSTPTLQPAIDTATLPAPPVDPILAPGSFSAFQAFAVEIGRAIKDKNASFFAEHASTSEWNCLGDETVGICKGQPVDQHLQGIPVAQDWMTYKVYEQIDYQNYWKSAFDQSREFKLTAVANRFGDNPIMPMAEQSFQAVLSLDDSAEPVHILFFEYLDDTWVLRGELITLDHAKDWLDGKCASCYDTWMAWPK